MARLGSGLIWLGGGIAADHTDLGQKRYMALGDNGLGFVAKPLPLGAIYFLGARELGSAAPVIEEFAGGNALAELVANTYVNYLLDREMRSREFDVLGRVVDGIPIRRVRPQADASTVFNLCDSIAADARRVLVGASASATSSHG